MKRTDYQKHIVELIGDRADPRHIEAMMRLEHDVLDWMSPDRFRAEVERAVYDCRSIGTKEVEKLAKSMGF